MKLYGLSWQITMLCLRPKATSFSNSSREPLAPVGMLASDVYEGEDIILKITAEKRDTGSQIYLSYQSGYVEGLVLDTEGNVKDCLLYTSRCV